jgi:hypothetical protein
MTCHHRTFVLDSRLGHRRARRGFSFAEVMFAVVILGIGFIMVAAIFPVAIQQSQATSDESTAASAAREAINTIAAMPRTVANLDNKPQAGNPAVLPMFPPTVKNYTIPPPPVAVGVVPPPAIVVPFTGPRWEAIKRSVILASDPRYAYVPLYRRDNGSSAAQLIVIAVQVRNRPTYDLVLDTGFTSASKQVRSVTAGTNPNGFTPVPLTNITICPDTMTVAPLTGPAPQEGDSVSVSPSYSVLSKSPGRTYHLGTQTGVNTYNLDAGDGMIQGGGSDGLWGTRDSTATPPVTDSLDYKLVSGTDTISAPVAGVTNPTGLAPPATLQPRVAYAQLRMDPGSAAGRVTLFADPATNKTPDFAAPGAFVVISDDYPFDPATNGGTYVAPGSYKVWPNIVPPSTATLGTAQYTLGALNGRVFRLGQLVPADPTANPPILPGTYDLDPAYGMRPPQGISKYSPDTMPNPDLVTAHPASALNNLRAKVYMIGKGRTDPTNATGQFAPVDYSGGAQDIAVFTTYIPAE